MGFRNYQSRLLNQHELLAKSNNSCLNGEKFLMPQNSMLNSQTNRVMMLRHSYEASNSPKPKKEPEQQGDRGSNHLEVDEIRFKYFSQKKE